MTQFQLIVVSSGAWAMRDRSLPSGSSWRLLTHYPSGFRHQTLFCHRLPVRNGQRSLMKGRRLHARWSMLPHLHPTRFPRATPRLLSFPSRQKADANRQGVAAIPFVRVSAPITRCGLSTIKEGRLRTRFLRLPGLKPGSLSNPSLCSITPRPFMPWCRAFQPHRPNDGRLLISLPELRGDA